MIVSNVVLDVGVAVVFVNHFISLGKTSLQLILLLGRIQMGVMFGLAIDMYTIINCAYVIVIAIKILSTRKAEIFIQLKTAMALTLCSAQALFSLWAAKN